MGSFFWEKFAPANGAALKISRYKPIIKINNTHNIQYEYPRNINESEDVNVSIKYNRETFEWFHPLWWSLW